MKNICKKTIVISIILLLIGVSVSSAISVDTKPTISKNEGVEDCGCEEVSESDLIKVEKLLNNLEVYSKLLLVLSKYNPELRDLSEELFYEIITLKEELTDKTPFPFICDILNSTFLSLSVIYDYFAELFDSLSEDSILRILIVPWLIIIETVTTPIFILLIMFDCWYIPPPLLIVI